MEEMRQSLRIILPLIAFEAHVTLVAFEAHDTLVAF